MAAALEPSKPRAFLQFGEMKALFATFTSSVAFNSIARTRGPERTSGPPLQVGSKDMEAAAERALIRRAKTGDRDAIAALIEAHHRPVEMFLLRLCGRPDLAEDLAQEAFMRVMRSLDRFDERFRFSTWLFTIAKRLLVNNLQKMKPTSDSDLVELRAAAYSTPATENEAIEEGRLGREMLDTGLASLEEPQLEIVLLFHQQNWPVHRIAERLKMPEGTVKSHLFRARRKMLGAIEAEQERASAELRESRLKLAAARVMNAAAPVMNAAGRTRTADVSRSEFIA